MFLTVALALGKDNLIYEAMLLFSLNKVNQYERDFQRQATGRFMDAFMRLRSFSESCSLNQLKPCCALTNFELKGTAFL